MPRAILLLHSPDQRGLVAKISDFVFRHGGNIVHADHHIDPECGLFLMRVEWDLDGFQISREEIAPTFHPLACDLNLRWELRFSDYRQRIAIMVSKYDHCLYDLLLREASGEFQATVALVIGNHPETESVTARFNVPFFLFPIDRQNKTSQEKKELELLTEQRVDVIVLARYMQILSANFASQYPNRIINIHHSFLPAFVGSRPYHQAYERGVKLIGVTSHYVTEELDAGPIIEQDVIRISHRDSVEDLVRKGRDLERTVLGRAVRLHLESRVLPYGKKTAVFE